MINRKNFLDAVNAIQSNEDFALELTVSSRKTAIIKPFSTNGTIQALYLSWKDQADDEDYRQAEVIVAALMNAAGGLAGPPVRGKGRDRLSRTLRNIAGGGLG